MSSIHKFSILILKQKIKTKKNRQNRQIWRQGQTAPCKRLLFPSFPNQFELIKSFFLSHSLIYFVLQSFNYKRYLKLIVFSVTESKPTPFWRLSLSLFLSILECKTNFILNKIKKNEQLVTEKDTHKFGNQ